MYIAIEGIKGSGKSTILKALNAKTQNIAGLQHFPITAPMSLTHPLEQALTTRSTYSIEDRFVEKLFLNRAYWHHKTIDPYNGIVLGDRSIATACVTRWNKWSDPYYTINRIKEQYQGILPLNIIVWLKTDVKTSLERINKRNPKSTGIKDETETALSLAVATYEELFKEKIYHRKIGRIQFIELDNKDSVDQTSAELLNILKFYTIK